METTPLPPPPTTPVRPDDEVPARRHRRRSIWIGLGAGVGILVVLAVVGILSAGGGSSFPDSLDGLERIRSAEAEAFEEGLDEFAFGDIRITGAMYGTSDEPLLLVERIDGPDEQVGLIPLEATWEGVVFGFENAGSADIDEDANRAGERAGFAIICAPATFVPNPTIPEGTATICAWKGASGIGVVFDFRDPDATAGLDSAGRIAEALEGT